MGNQVYLSLLAGIVLFNRMKFRYNPNPFFTIENNYKYGYYPRCYFGHYRRYY